MIKHEKFETNSIILLVGILLTVAIGGLVEIVPLFTIGETIEKVEGVRPLSPLELAGRNIYISEGCYNCHSQQVRPFRDEVERYGHYSLAAESIYDHPFQWGSKRTGPDLARVGGKYSNDWQAAHLIDPRSVVPESIMPTYAHLAKEALEMPDVAEHLKTLRIVGVPYTDEMISDAAADLAAQATPDADTSGLLQRYPKAVVGDLDGDPARITKMDALVAYLQSLGRMVDFTTYRPELGKQAEGGQ
ncbi:cytochrome-c oxidase, cbb3-type subunit II [Dongia sp.]|uniref:cytochrome-c oxidase, cbb3-type subunit II n=1 Tax=Dongia sp. TaxID=1977262 RepID=UPI0035B22354